MSVHQGCGCCNACGICAGDGCGWTVESGTADLSVPGQITTTSTTTLVATVVEDVSGSGPTGTDGTAVRASVDYVAGNTGSSAMLLLKYKDTTHYLYARAIVGSSAVGVLRRDGGSPATLATGSFVTVPGETYTLKACYGEGGVSFELWYNGERVAYGAGPCLPSIDDEPKAGVGSLGASSSNIVFTNFVYEHSHETGVHDTCETCYVPCEYRNDLFNRSLIGTDWTVVAGTWSIATNVLKTSSANAILVYNITAPVTDPRGIRIKAVLNQASPASKIRLMLGYVDTDNYYAAEFFADSTAPYTKIIERSGGSETTLVERYGVRGTYANFCFQPAQQRLIAGFGSDIGGDTYRYPLVVDGVSSLPNWVAALGTGGTVGSGAANPTFDNFFVSIIGVGTTCIDCDDCPVCLGSRRVGIGDVEVVISGTSGVSGLNGTYILPYRGGGAYDTIINVFGGGSSDVCYWEHKISSSSYITVILTGSLSPSADKKWWVFWGNKSEFEGATAYIRMVTAAVAQNCISGTYTATATATDSASAGKTAGTAVVTLL